MGQRAAAVEQARQRVCEQRAAHHRSGDDFRLLEQLAGQTVEQVLRQPPDRRRMPEQLMRIQIDAAVKPVAVVEVAVAHEHFELLRAASAPAGAFVACCSTVRQVPAFIVNTTSIAVDDPSADDRRGDGAAQLPAVERRVLRFRLQRRRANR